MPDTFWQRVSALVADLREAWSSTVKETDPFDHMHTCGKRSQDCSQCRLAQAMTDEQVVLEGLEDTLAETEETHKHLRPRAECLHCGSPLKVPADPQAPPRALFCQNPQCPMFAQFVDPTEDLCPPDLPSRPPVKIETVTETGSPRVFYTGEEYVSVSLKRDILWDLMLVVTPHCRTADGIADARRAIARVLDTHLGGGETPVFD